MLFSITTIKTICEILAQLATVIGVFAALIGVNEYHKQAAEKRQDAALTLINTFSVLINNVLEVIENPQLYEHEEYYPFSVPEIASQKEKRLHKERPARLIFNYLNELKKTYLECSSVMGEYPELNKIMHSIDKKRTQLADSLHGKFDSDKFEHYLEDLQSDLDHAKKILTIIMEKL